jgi:hypothetical protein
MRTLLFALAVGATCLSAAPARAEKVLAKGTDWEVYTDGRAGSFVSYVNGDAFPQTKYGLDPNGNQVVLHDIKGGGTPDALAARQPANDGIPGDLTQGTINSMRIRSGFIANTFGFGVRNKIGERTIATSYIQIWAVVESEARQKNRPNLADVRQGYVKLEGPWGYVLAGRSRGLFSRGATDIDALYGHRWGVGFPGNVGLDSFGPTQGHVGFGVLGSGFGAQVTYGTPVMAGLQLTVGLFDPIELQNGAWVRTTFARPEAELTFERPLGAVGKIVLFGNGAYQKVYQNGFCDPNGPVPCSVTSAGFGYGGRFEVGPVRLGVAGHYGRGLGLNYAMEVSDANVDSQNNLRRFDGYYVQSQLVLGRVDLSAGWGITRVFLNPSDNDTVPDPTAADPTTVPGVIPHSVIKYQMGMSGGIVFHVSQWVHVDFDVFRAKAAWFLGETQVLWVYNAGMIMNW